jgi:hypothetical protein
MSNREIVPDVSPLSSRASAPVTHWGHEDATGAAGSIPVVSDASTATVAAGVPNGGSRRAAARARKRSKARAATAALALGGALLGFGGTFVVLQAVNAGDLAVVTPAQDVVTLAPPEKTVDVPDAIKEQLPEPTPSGPIIYAP